jgi:hypothetical protein
VPRTNSSRPLTKGDLLEGRALFDLDGDNCPVVLCGVQKPF